MSVTSHLDINHLPQTDRLLSVLKKGIGFHHAGMIPVLKEIVEILYTQKIIRILFTTETFAVGMNMPVKTAIFDDIEKHDGRSFRPLFAREFFQMAGRAGRRGIDDEGWVLVKNPIVTRDRKKHLEYILTEKSEPLKSQFSLSYNSILNMIEKYRIDEIKSILERNFFQYQNKQKVINKNLMPDCSYSMAQEEFIHIKKSHFQKNDAPCINCNKRKNCLKYIKHTRGFKEYIQTKSVRMSFSFFNEFMKKKEFLERLGYVNSEGLTSRGRFATLIPSREIEITELMSEGIFDEAGDAALAIIIAGLVTERRRRDSANKLKNPKVLYFIEKAESILERVILKEKSIGYKSIENLDTLFASPVYSWYNGADFSKVCRLAVCDEGDMIKLFRQVCDTLRHIKKAADFPLFKSRITSMIKIIRRDVVEASEYFSED